MNRSKRTIFLVEWVCQRRKGAFPKVLEQTLSDRDQYLLLLKEEKEKPDCDPKLIEEYQTHQLGAKLFAYAGFGLFSNEYFEFSNYQVAECITAEGKDVATTTDFLFEYYIRNRSAEEDRPGGMGYYLRRVGSKEIISYLKSNPRTADLMKKTFKLNT